MASVGRGLRVWASLVLLILCSWTGSRAAAPNPVRNLRVGAQSNSSITLLWEAPEDSDPQNLIYWVQWTGDDGTNVTRNTTDTSITVDGLNSASWYEFSVWVEKDGIPGSREVLAAATAPNPVRNLRVGAQSNSSITLLWEAPEDSDSQNLTYWVQWTGDDGTNVTRNTTDTSITVDGLNSASWYEFSVWVEKDGIPGSREVLAAATAPNPVRNLRVGAQSNSSITLLWEAPEDSDSQNLIYWVQWTGDDGTNVTRNTTDTSITVDGLNSASWYEFSVWVEKDGIPGSREVLAAATAPNPVRNLRVGAQSNSSITLLWEAPEDSDSRNLTYWVQCTGDDGTNVTRNTTDTSVTVDGLNPGLVYECSTWVENDGVSSSRVALSTATAPNGVRNLRVGARSNSSITLLWEALEDSDSRNLIYWVQCTGEGGTNETQNTTDPSVTVDGLDPGSLYEFRVWVEKNGVNGSQETQGAATVPNAVAGLRKQDHTNSSITLNWTAPMGPLAPPYTYLVSWVEAESSDPASNSTSDTSITLTALQAGSLYNVTVRAQRNGVSSDASTLTQATAPNAVTITSCVSTSAGYGVILTWSCPLGRYQDFEWQVGGQSGFLNGTSCDEGVPVRGLQPAQSYLATVTTLSNGMRAPSVPVTCRTESAGVIAGVVVGLLALIVVGLLVFFLKKSYKKRQEKEVPRDLVFSFPGDILAQDFAEHVRRNEKDSNCGFAEEYQELALEGHGQSQMVALAPENKAKNRYRNVLPYDWSRVPLQPLHEEPGSDYINASFMPGLWSSREFIAAQGPLPHTVGDFWRLVWEQQSHTLVMLTNCMESGRVKCEHYWPLDAHPCTHGDLQVTLVDETVMENWTVRDLQLLHMEDRKTLSVRQFHYLAWPDHGVPHPDPLLAFWKVLRQWLDQTKDGGLPIVHCSAGVGRTGTLIALDVLLRQLECEGLVGPFNFVRKMRESRPLMVQTEAQYVFLHQCILRYLQQSASALPQSEVIYENVPKLTYENVAAIRAHELEV